MSTLHKKKYLKSYNVKKYNLNENENIPNFN